MKGATRLTVVALTVFGGMLLAQAQAPKPGPEHKRLAYFVGKWNMEGEMKASPFGPGGKMTGTEHSEWLGGGFFLVSNSQGKLPMGEVTGHSVLGYDREGKTYTYNGFDSTGMAESGKGTVAGDTWTWTGEGKIAGKPYKVRFTIKEVSPTSYTMKWESSSDGGPFQTIMEGKSTKAK